MILAEFAALYNKYDLQSHHVIIVNVLAVVPLVYLIVHTSYKVHAVSNGHSSPLCSLLYEPV